MKAYFLKQCLCCGAGSMAMDQPSVQLALLCAASSLPLPWQGPLPFGTLFHDKGAPKNCFILEATAQMAKGAYSSRV